MLDWERDGDHLAIALEPEEASCLRNLVGQIATLLRERAAASPHDELAELTGMRTGSSTPPDNRVLARLLPDFHRPDKDAAEPGETDLSGALRSLHEPDLIDAKTDAGEVVLRTCPVDGGRVRLTEQEADAWLAAINDARLALGTALDIREDTPEVASGDPNPAVRGIYEWLTTLQDGLIDTVAG
jgi:hypothetical protein